MGRESSEQGLPECRGARGNRCWKKPELWGGGATTLGIMTAPPFYMPPHSPPITPTPVYTRSLPSEVWGVLGHSSSVCCKHQELLLRLPLILSSTPPFCPLPSPTCSLPLALNLSSLTDSGGCILALDPQREKPRGLRVCCTRNGTCCSAQSLHIADIPPSLPPSLLTSSLLLH